MWKKEQLRLCLYDLKKMMQIYLPRMWESKILSSIQKSVWKRTKEIMWIDIYAEREETVGHFTIGRVLRYQSCDWYGIACVWLGMQKREGSQEREQ